MGKKIKNIFILNKTVLIIILVSYGIYRLYHMKQEGFESSNEKQLMLLKYSNYYFNFHKKNKVKFIVSRYNENLDWITILRDNIVLYNKGNELKNWNYTKLKNVGRESDTYLHYIIENYNSLPDYCVFTQGNIEDHAANGYIYLISIAIEAVENGKSNPRFRSSEGCWSPDFNLKEKGGAFSNYQNNKVISFRNWFIENINKEYPKILQGYQNGLFAVSKKKILQNTIDYYIKLKKTVEWHINPVEGHFLERSWYYIFE